MRTLVKCEVEDSERWKDESGGARRVNVRDHVHDA